MKGSSIAVIHPDRGGGSKMRKLLSVFVAMAFVLSLAAVATAEVKKAEPAEPAAPAAPAKPAEPMKAAEPAKKPAAKKAAKAMQLTGTVEAIDAAAGTLTVKGKKDSVSLKAGEKVRLEGIAVGDKVLVKYSGDSASSVKKVTAKKAAKKEAPTKAVEPAKKEAAPAAPAAPAAK